ncbi:MAG TPA: alpha-amylase family glycosyl hydrolase [Jatrophihabitans sp.]|nr:alpha-amylase family glycosyl hydrolase [Jatrophihabitans sp.]
MTRIPELPLIDDFETLTIAGFAVRPGDPRRLGASQTHQGGINFSIYSEAAESMTLVLIGPGYPHGRVELPFPASYRTGRIFSMVVYGLDLEATEYGYRAAGPAGLSGLMADPYAARMTGRDVWGAQPDRSVDYPYRSALVRRDFDWGDDRPPRIPLSELVIYEANVRAFTAAAPDVDCPGTFAGLAEKAEYLRSLGVNCVELLPVFEFDELDVPRENPDTHEPLRNLWGYNTIGFFSPKAGLAASGGLGMQADEFKAMVEALHAAGIEVVLDVVFNHTAEGNENGPTISFRGLANEVFYMLDGDHRYLNYSGTGNTVNSNHPIVRQFIIDCLRYWVAEYHVDGFRFDLASILDRDADGTPLARPPVIEALAADPILRDCKLIAEAWDAGGLYQVGTFPAYGRWSEWNGKFRDCVRRFLKGDENQVGELATRIAGSPDLYPDRGPTASVNFVTAHDGYTLADLVSYQQRWNWSNGEQNRDGTTDNHNWNHGVEGPTDDPEVNRLRSRQMKNALVLLMMSHGVPMLLAGDEVARSQRGNNNAYCQDNEISYFDWSQVADNAELLRFTTLLIAARKRHRVVRGAAHPGRDGAARFNWHGRQPDNPDWSAGSRLLVVQMCYPDPAEDDLPVLLAANSGWWTEHLTLPSAGEGREWRRLVATWAGPGADITADGAEFGLDPDGSFALPDRSCAVLVARPIAH